MQPVSPSTRLTQFRGSFGPGSKWGNTRLRKAGFSKMPVSSMLVLGLSIPHPHKGNRHGRPSYVLVHIHAIRPRPGCGTAQPPCVASPEVAAPGAAGFVCPGPRRSSTSLGPGPGTWGQPQVPLSASPYRGRRADACIRSRIEAEGCPLLLARNQGLVASTGLGLGVDRPQLVSGGCRIAPRPLRLAYLLGYGTQHRLKRR